MKLKSPGPVSVAGKVYEQATDGTIDVPEEHAVHLVETHGCEYLPEPDPKRAKKAASSD